MKPQEFYNNVCTSLRTYGNQYGKGYSRGWKWVDDSNPNNRCAIARFIKGNNDTEVVDNIITALELGPDAYLFANELVCDVVSLFDNHPDTINNKHSLECALRDMAYDHHLVYNSVQVVSKTETA
jgi:hypothetical protein